MDTNIPSLGFLPFKKDDKECEGGNKLNIVKKFKLRVEKDKTNLFVKKLKYRGMRLLPLTTEVNYLVLFRYAKIINTCY